MLQYVVIIKIGTINHKNSSKIRPKLGSTQISKNILGKKLIPRNKMKGLTPTKNNLDILKFSI